MSFTLSNYTLRTASLIEDEVKAVLCGALELNPRSTTMTISNDNSFLRFEFEERMLNFMQPSTPEDPLRHIDATLAQLDEWKASDRTGNAMAQRAAIAIRHLRKQVEELETAAKAK